MARRSCDSGKESLDQYGASVEHFLQMFNREFVQKKCTSIEKWPANAITNSQSWVLMLLAMYVPKQKILVWKHSVIKAAQWLHTYSMQP